MDESRGLLWRYYLFRTTNSAGFYVPVAILYLRDSGFGLDFIAFAYAVFGFATLAAEIPTGYLGDWLGRRKSLAVGAVLRVSVLVAYPLVDGATAILTLHVVWATGRTFRSGTQDAWLYELLSAHFDEDEFARIEGRGSTALLVTSAGGAILGGLLYTTNVAAPFLANATLAAAGIPLLYTFPKVNRAHGDSVTESATDSSVFTTSEAVQVLRLQARRPSIRWLVAYAALFHALFLVTRVYEQPALNAVGVPVAGLGLLYAGFKLVSAAAASTAGLLEERVGARRVFVLLIPVYAVAYGAIALVPALVIPTLFLNRGIRVLTRPIRNQYLNDRLDDVGRATVLSGASMVLSLFGIVARIAAGSYAEMLGPVGVLPWSALPVVVAATVLWVAVSPVRGSDHAADTASNAVPAD